LCPDIDMHELLRVGTRYFKKRLRISSELTNYVHTEGRFYEVQENTKPQTINFIIKYAVPYLL